MKVSKVNHVRSSVSVKKAQPEGVLYHSPKQIGKRKKDVKELVQDAGNSARKLYKLFGDKNSMAASESDAYKTLVKYMGNLIDALKDESKSNASPEENVNNQLNYLKNLSSKRIFVKEKDYLIPVEEIHISWAGTSQEEIADCLAYGGLRSSMKRTVSAFDQEDAVFLPDVVKKLVLAVSSGSGFEEKFNEIPEREVKAFMFAFNEDYFKNRQLECIENSIKNQNVKVQCVKENNEYRLCPSGASNPKKKYLFDFLKEYASSEPAERDRMMIHFRQLVLLYYCGSETYRKSMENWVGAWSFGSFLLDAEGPVSEKALELYDQAQNAKADSSEYIKTPDYKKKTLEIKQELRKTIADLYRRSVKEEGLTDADLFWLQYIEGQAEQHLSHTEDLNRTKLSKEYLCKKTVQEWISYIGMKYVDMGKAVYHFAMPKGDEMKTASRYGEVLPDYKEGITSFDYEHIKAKESLTQELFSAVSFAVGNYDRAARSAEERHKQEDVLLLLNSVNMHVRDDAVMRLLQFFGGKGSWTEEDGSLKENLRDAILKQDETNSAPDMGKQIAVAIGKELKQIRNFTFHYAGGWAAVTPEKDATHRGISRAIFEQEYAHVGYMFRKKYYSNNVLMFYPRDKIDNLIKKLYEKPVKRPSQIPAFSRILNKAQLKEFKFVDSEEEKKLWSIGADPRAVVENYQNTLLFLLKEIYYYGFLQAKDLRDMFLNALERQKENPAARDNLKERINELDPHGNIEFGKLCQGIMTDFDLQNKGMRKIPSGSAGKKSQKYKHFRTLLYLGIREAFLDWLKENPDLVGFLISPHYKENWADSVSEKEFCNKEDIQLYSNIPAMMEDERSVLYSWYIMAHFLNQRQLNFLIGDLKNYTTFIEDIDKRTTIAGSRAHGQKETAEEKKQFEKVIAVLEFSKLFCEQVTNCLEDYFKDEEAYGKYLSAYVAWEDVGCNSLKDFCGQELKELKGNDLHPMLGIYYDGQNPIVNRNVVLSEMYGNEELLTACMKDARVTEEEILEWYQLEAELQGKSGNGRNLFREQYCATEEEQLKVRDYQNRKNRIELIDLMFYSEMVNDLMSQLRKWCYLRERDLMYCQLGIHYIGLYYGDEGTSDNDKWLDKLDRPKHPIKRGAALYQIAAMYTFGLHVYGRDEDGNVVPEKDNSKTSTGNKVTAFVKKYCGGDEGIYSSGLYLFEDYREHDDMSTFRNAIDHFRYETDLNCSILSLYGVMFDSFLRYDIKLQKSVPIILKNILLKHFIIADLDFCKETENVGRKADTGRATTTIRFREGEDSVRSDILTYKLQSKSKNTQNNEEPAKVPARSPVFVEMVKKMLQYKA